MLVVHTHSRTYVYARIVSHCSSFLWRPALNPHPEVECEHPVHTPPRGSPVRVDVCGIVLRIALSVPQEVQSGRIRRGDMSGSLVGGAMGVRT